MRLFEIKNIQKCPYPGSVIQNVLYHGTHEQFSKFLRPSHGVYVTPLRSWAKEHYGKSVIQIYANVSKIYELPIDSEERYDFYDRDYDAVSAFLSKLSKKGYNCCKFGGESESMVLFNDISITNAITGNTM